MLNSILMNHFMQHDLKENQRLVLDKPEIRLDEWNVAQYAFRRIPIARNGPEFGLNGKVDFYKRNIPSLREVPYSFGLANLTRAFHYQRQSIWVRFPCHKLRLEFPLKEKLWFSVFHTCNISYSASLRKSLSHFYWRMSQSWIHFHEGISVQLIHFQ